jgi:hypothetical protein
MNVLDFTKFVLVRRLFALYPPCYTFLFACRVHCLTFFVSFLVGLVFVSCADL